MSQPNRGDHSPSRDDTPGATPSRPWWQPYAIVAAATAVALLLMVWQVVARGPFIAWDWPFHAWVDARQPSGALRTALDVVASIGGQRLFTAPIVIGVAVWAAYRRRSLRPLMAIAAGLATVFFVGYAIKFGLSRTPPADGVDMLHGDGQAFPSGHTANATLTWTMVVILIFGVAGFRPDARLFRRWLGVALGMIFVAGVLMTALDYHWVSDIPGGWALGILAIMVSVIALGPPPTPRQPDDARERADSAAT